jgi:hypothetical protein
VVCGACNAPHHVECWSDNGGCAVIGCVGGPTRDAVTPATTPAVTRTARDTPTPTLKPQPGVASPDFPRGSRSPQLSIAVLVLALAILGVAAAVILTRPGNKTIVITRPNKPRPATTGPTAPTGPTSNQSTGTARATTVSNPGPLGPAASVREFWREMNDGNYQAAHKLMTAHEQSDYPNFVADRSTADPRIILLSVGSASYNGSGEATVPIEFYAQDRYPSPGSDTVCRLFDGYSPMVEGSGGHWYYDGFRGSAVAEPSGDCNS